MGFEVLDTLSGAHLGYEGFSFADSIVGYQERGRFADDLLAGVAEHPLCGWVPARDDTVESPPKDGIPAVLDDRRYALSDLERLPLLGHVPVGCRGADDYAVRIAHRRDGDRDGDYRPVLSDPIGLEVLDVVASVDLGQHVRELARSVHGNQETE